MELLTGKCREDFEKWYVSIFKDIKVSSATVNTVRVNTFKIMHPSMQYGVLVDFFDENKLEIYIKKIAIEKYSIYIDNVGHHVLDSYIFCKTLQEARIKAIEKANEIYNKNN